MIDQQDVPGEAERAQQHIPVPLRDGEGLLHTEQIQSRHRQRHAEPDGPGCLFMEEDPRDGHDDDVQCRDEPRLAGGGGLQSHLLEIGGHGQRHAAAGAADGQIPPGAGPGLRFAVKVPLPQGAEHQAQHQQEHERHRASGSCKGKWLHMVCGHALGHEGSAPDQGRQHGEHVLTDVVDFHRTCSSPGSMLYFCKLPQI